MRIKGVKNLYLPVVHSKLLQVTKASIYLNVCDE